MKLDPINEMLFDFEELILLYRGRLMAAPMVLIISCSSFLLCSSVASSQSGTEMVAVVSVTYCGTRIHSIKAFTKVTVTQLRI